MIMTLIGGVALALLNIILLKAIAKDAVAKAIEEQLEKYSEVIREARELEDLAETVKGTD